MTPTSRPLLAAAALALGCGGDAARSPSCGLALIAGPTLIQQRLTDPRAVLVDAPRGLPQTLPARVAGRSEMGNVMVGYDGPQPVLQFDGVAFPTRPGYALLVVDDTSQRAMGVLIYDREGPETHPRLGTVHGPQGGTVPLYGVYVDWAGVSNPRCPLLGAPTPPPPPSGDG
ncbi:MAG: hypothetical protein ACREMJ_00505 [Gemmatimonadales bacterium]